jgi:hypothetical protein
MMEGFLLIAVVIILLVIVVRSPSIFDHRCPHCREKISGNVTTCSFCGKDVPKQKWTWEQLWKK